MKTNNKIIVNLVYATKQGFDWVNSLCINSVQMGSIFNDKLLNPAVHGAWVLGETK